MLLTSAVTKRRRTYEYLAAATIGPSGKFAVELSMIGLMLGTCIAFYVIIGDLATEIVSSFVEVDHEMLRTYVIVFCGLCVALPLGLMKSLAALGFIGYFSLIFYSIFVCVMFQTSASHGLLSFDWLREIKFFEPRGVFQCLPIFSLAYACHCQLFVVYDSLDDPSLPKMEYIVKSSLKIVTTVYSLVAIFGYTTFSDSVEGNVLRNFPSTTLLSFIKIGFAASVVVGFPLMIFPCRQSIHTLFFKQNFNDGLAPKTYIEPFTFKTLTLAIVFTTMLVAILIPNVETVLGLTGATMGSLICFIMPAIIFMKADYSTSQRVPKFVLAIGCLLFVVCTYSNVYPAVDEAAVPAPVVKQVINDNQMVLPTVADIKSILSEGEVKEKDEVLNPLEPDENVVNVHRHEPANPEPPIIIREHADMEDVNQVDNQRQAAKMLKLEKQQPKVIEAALPESIVQNLGKANKEAVDKPIVDIEQVKKQSEKIKTEKKETFDSVNNVGKPAKAAEQEAEKLKEQAQLLKKIKESNEVQSKLLEKQRELLEVLEKQKPKEGGVVELVAVNTSPGVKLVDSNDQQEQVVNVIANNDAKSLQDPLNKDGSNAKSSVKKHQAAAQVLPVIKDQVIPNKGNEKVPLAGIKALEHDTLMKEQPQQNIPQEVPTAPKATAGDKDEVRRQVNTHIDVEKVQLEKIESQQQPTQHQEAAEPLKPKEVIKDAPNVNSQEVVNAKEAAVEPVAGKKKTIEGDKTLLKSKDSLSEDIDGIPKPEVRDLKSV